MWYGSCMGDFSWVCVFGKLHLAQKLSPCNLVLWFQCVIYSPSLIEGKTGFASRRLRSLPDLSTRALGERNALQRTLRPYAPGVCHSYGKRQMKASGLPGPRIRTRYKANIFWFLRHKPHEEDTGGVIALSEMSNWYLGGAFLVSTRRGT